MKFGWKTITGALLYGLGVAGAPDALALIPTETAGILQAFGVVIGGVGVRHAIAKVEAVRGK